MSVVDYIGVRETHTHTHTPSEQFQNIISTVKLV